MIQNGSWFKMIKICDNLIKKLISESKFHRNHVKLSFPMVCIYFYATNDPARSKNDLKWSKIIKKWFKMIQHDQRSNYVIMWFKKWISDVKFYQNHDKLWFLMVFIDFNVIYDPGRSKNDLKWSKMIKNDQK